MAIYKMSLYMLGEFSRKQVDDCFKVKPELYLEKGEKNAGGRVVKQSICNIEISNGTMESLFLVFDEFYDDLKDLCDKVVLLREQETFQSFLRVMIKTDAKHSMPAIGLDLSIIELLCNSKTEFDLDCYDYSE